MADALATYTTRRTPQTRPANPRQSRNRAGGYTFTVAPQTALRRFLILGVDSGTYYARPPELAAQNAELLLQYATDDHRGLVDTIVEVSTSGAAPKPNPALFALAVAASRGTTDEKTYALAQLPRVARTGTHLFTFSRYVEQFRGWGRGLRRGVASWYTDSDVDRLAYQMVKYRSRGGTTHRGMLRQSHPAAGVDLPRRALFDWACNGTVTGDLPAIVHGFLAAQQPGADLPKLIRDYGLTWEMLPSEALTRTDVWQALVENGMPTGALLRNLPTLTRVGLIAGRSSWTTAVTEQLTNLDALRGARIHPMSVLVALRTYAAGRGDRGKHTWQPNPAVTDALDTAFYRAFKTVEPTGKRTMIGLDVSGSMGVPVAGMPLTAAEACTAMAMVTAASEPECDAYAFTSSDRSIWRRRNSDSTELTRLDLSSRRRLDDVLAGTSRMTFGRTDCSLPMRHAIDTGAEVDTFIVYTDNETWYGDEHPYQALRRYRDTTGIPAKLIVVAATATKSTIADPDDPGMLDVVGLDDAAPTVIADFSRGGIGGDL